MKRLRLRNCIGMQQSVALPLSAERLKRGCELAEVDGNRHERVRLFRGIESDVEADHLTLDSPMVGILKLVREWRGV